MGVNMTGITPDGAPAQGKNPNPFRFTIDLIDQVGPFVVARVIYPDCTNYEGNKILVFKGTTVEKIRKRRKLDPHFTGKGKIRLVARFEPTDEGWMMACSFAREAWRA